MTPSLRSTLRASFHLHLFPSGLPQYFALTFHLSHATYRPCPSHLLWADNPNNISCMVRITNVLIIYYLQPFRSKYSPQHPLPEQLPSMHFHVHEKVRHPLTKPHKKTENQNCKLQTSLITKFNKLPIYFSYDLQTLPIFHNFRHTQLLKKKENYAERETKTFSKLCRIIPCRNESAVRQRW